MEIKTIKEIIESAPVKDVDRKKFSIKLSEINIIKSTPTKEISCQVKSTTETAFQRAIFFDNDKQTKVSTFDNYIQWIDIELPIQAHGASRVDLIGKTKNGIGVLCELKYGKIGSISDSPYSAVLELLVYQALINRDFIRLDNNKGSEGGHPNCNNNWKWESFSSSKTPILIMGANEEYWEYWTKKRHNGGKKCIMLNVLKDWVSKLPINILLASIPEPTPDFKEQKKISNSINYSASLCDSSKKEWKIL